MIRIGLTGGIGSGKTYVAQQLALLGIPVYDSDSRAKELTVTDPVIRKGLITLLGEEVYQRGRLNKALLASFLFASPENTAQVNRIIHPAVFRDFDRWCAETGREIVGLESAILFESGFYRQTDVVWVVTAPVELRIRRAMERDGVTREAVEARMEAQMDDLERMERADAIIVNDGVRPVLPQLKALLHALEARKIHG